MNMERFGPWPTQGRWTIGLSGPIGQTAKHSDHEPTEDDWAALEIEHMKHEQAEEALLKEYRAALA